MEGELGKLLEDESEDAILARIQEESLRYYNEIELPRRAAEGFQPQEESNNKLNSNHINPQPHCSRNIDNIQVTSVRDVFYKESGQGAEGFHLAAGDTYVYPTNYPIRKYQKDITHSALFHNTLVSLPTGLGKTFIAAVVMYNYYRWFPQGKIVFMAPTRPLVAQQIRACHDIMAIPINDTVEMTGSMNPVDRLKHWKNKRVFFLTPQVMTNDLRSGVCPATFFKCVVIDEAHRATKEYSYCHVIKELEKAGAVFRILALSATPGSNVKAVIEVVQNLRISTLELREEDSADVSPYTHAKKIEPVALNLSKPIMDFREQFLLIFERYAKSLKEARLVTCNVQNLTKFQLLKASEKVRLRPPQGMAKTRLGILMSDFNVCMTLAHGHDLLQTYGLRAFYQYITGCEDEENRKAAFTRLNQDVEFHELINNIRNAVSSPMDQMWSHPKHEQLVNILKEHFSQAEENGSSTKVIIFCQYRIVVNELYNLLLKIHPIIKPVMFIGQGAGKDKSGLPQKKQIEIMKQFREGKSNVMIATCVAEEGLDIGSVDLLILMEVQRSPVRLVQRLGRTGRHAKGRCVVLLTQGKEVQKFYDVMATKKSFLKNILNSKLLTANLYKNEPTMVPPYLMPKIQLVHINVPERITPGKRKKQSDIRQVLMAKLNDTEEVIESPFLLPEQVAVLKEEMNTLQVNYDTFDFTKSAYLHPRVNGTIMESEELFSSVYSQLSEFNEWNRVLQQTYLLSHSSDTEILCHLLKKAEAMHLGVHSDLNSQMNFNRIGVTNKKITTNKRKLNFDDVNAIKKNENEERHHMDFKKGLSLTACITQEENAIKNDPPVSSELLLETVVESKSLIAEQNVNEINPSNESNCSLCNQQYGKLCSQLNNSPKPLSDTLLTFTLTQLLNIDVFMKNLTKNLISDINVVKTFSSGSGYEIKRIRKSIANFKNTTNFSIVESLAEKVTERFTFDNNDFKTPTNILPDKRLINSCRDNKITGNSNKNILFDKEIFLNADQEYFNLEDLFKDDDLDFGNVGAITKTSTPMFNSNSATRDMLINNDDTVIDGKAINFTMVGFGKNKLKSSPSTGLTKLITLPNKNLFKVPPMKLNFETFRSSQDSSTINETKSLSPKKSPLLGKIMSLNSLSVSKLEPKSLFQENKSEEEKDILSKPLDREKMIEENDASTTLTEVEEANITASQLFDDDLSEDIKSDNLEQSSMYTISQIIAKISIMADNIKSHNENSVQGKDNNKSTLETSNFENVEDDFMFYNINMDELSPKKDTYSNCKTSSASESKSNLKSSLRNCTTYEKFCIEKPNRLQDMQEVHGSNVLGKLSDTDNTFIDEDNLEVNSCLSKANINQDSSISSRWLSCLKSPIHQPDLRTSTPHSCKKDAGNLLTDSDSNSDVFHSPLLKKKSVTSYRQENLEKKGHKHNLFLEVEADVTGPPCSSDEENTSGLDDLDASFINDLTEHPTTSANQTSLDMQAQYLQSIKSPMGRLGGYKIPQLSNSVLARDVLSQDDLEEDNSYINDSFCCDATEYPADDDPSLLEIAENILNKNRKHKKVNKKRKQILKTSSESSAEDQKVFTETLNKKRFLSSESSIEDELIHSKKIGRIQQSSDSSLEDKPIKVKKPFKKKRRVHLLTSDSDSDRTI